MQPNSTFQTIEIYLGGRGLKDLDFFSKSDPYVKVSYRRDFNCKNYIVLGRTETKVNDLNPNFAKPITLDYIFESRQDIKFQVFDDDNGNDDFIGSVETTVGALMGAKAQTSILQLKCQKMARGKLIVRCEKVGTTNLNYQFKFKAQKLMNTDSIFDFWDKSDPYLKLLKIRSDNSLLLAYKTDDIKNNLNPSWPQFSLQASRLHQQNAGKFKIQCWDWQENGQDQFIGQAYLDCNQLKANDKFPIQIKLLNPKNKKPGVIILQKFRCFTRPTFVDYLRGGLELNMIIAIDFTGSNGTPTQPTSLHYMNQARPNQYQSAISAVGNIILNYDSDKRIPAFGFGADLKFPNMHGLSHCFPLSGNFDTVQSFGIEHLMQLYKQALSNLSLSGPTYFGPIIEQVAKLSAECRQRQQYVYQTLLILTDGQIHDMQKVIDLIISCADLPLSIIIVGVGSADFTNMDRLDGDGGLYGSNGQKAKRDIVQFVPFRNVQLNPDVLAQQLLAELPGQIVSYYQSIGIQPNAAQVTDMNTMMASQQINNQNNQGFANHILGIANININSQPIDQGQINPQINPYGQLGQE